MLYMNEWDIKEAEQRFTSHSVLGPAVKTLRNLVDWTNSHSDGWAYWPKPCRAAKSLMTLIQAPDGTPHYDTERTDATPAAYRKALAPIKSFRTRQGADFIIVEV